MSEQKEYLQHGNDVVAALIETLNVGLMDNFPQSRVDTDELEYLLDALRVLCVKMPELDMLEGLLQIVKRDWTNGKQIFRDLVDAGHCMPNAKAMLIYCMSMSGDNDWMVEAEKLLQNETSPDAVLMVRAVIARKHLLDAVELAKRTGTFEMPESIVALKADRERRQAEQAESAKPAPSEIDPSLMMSGQYMRM